MRWDSDHVVILSDELEAIAQELVRGDYLGRVHIGLDFFDASINRVAAWVIGTRCMLKALLLALLEPTTTSQTARGRGRLHGAAGPARGAQDAPLRRGLGPLLPEVDVPIGPDWIDEVKTIRARRPARRGPERAGETRP